MNQLACSACGGSLVPRQDGTYVCRQCGKPFSAEEISRMTAEMLAPQNVNAQFAPQYAPNAWNPNAQPTYNGMPAAQPAYYAQPKKSKKGLIIGLIAGGAALIAAAAILIALLVIVPNSKYNSAMELYLAGRYDEAIAAFEALDDYKYSKEMIKQCKAALGGSGFNPNDPTAPNYPDNPVTPNISTDPYAISADDIPDTMTSEDGTYEVAFVADVGPLKDHSFNQGTYDGVKLFASENGKSYKFYQPAGGSEATDEDRCNAMRAAADNGAKAIVCAGFMQGFALATVAAEYPDVNFIFIDGWSLGMDNVAGVVFQEEQCGYLAGYAAVMEGYTKLGFTGGGGGINDACCRYGYGFVQGADAAAKTKGEKIEIKYSWLYGSRFSASPELQSLCNGWYETGTEVIFVCGGQMFDSVTAAASAANAKVIGVDVDQSFQSNTVITSALKGIGEAAYQALEASFGVNGGDWSEWGNACVTLGAAQEAVGLPVDTWSLANWSVEDYEKLFAGIVDGSVAIDADFTKLGTNTPNVNLYIVE